jgi:hypothetical protein
MELLLCSGVVIVQVPPPATTTTRLPLIIEEVGLITTTRATVLGLTDEAVGKVCWVRKVLPLPLKVL